MEDKNHDYGEVWDVSVPNWFDFAKIRVKQIENNKGKTRRYWRQLSGHDQLFHFCTDTNGFR
jgi:hypothetical protein